MTKKYKLNYDWNGYEKGHVFEAGSNGYLSLVNKIYQPEIIDLLVLSGALTEMCACKNEGNEYVSTDTGHSYLLCSKCKKPIHITFSTSEVKKIEHAKSADVYGIRGWKSQDLADKINQLVDAVNSLFNTKLK